MLNISVLFNTETLRRKGCQKQTWNLKPRMGFVYLGTGNQHTAFCTPAPLREALPQRHSEECKCTWVPGLGGFVCFFVEFCTRSDSSVWSSFHFGSYSDNPRKMKHPSSGNKICPVGSLETPRVAPGLTGSSGFSQPVRLGLPGPKQAEAMEKGK